MTKTAFRCVLLVPLSSFALPPAAESQALWLDRGDGDVIFVEVHKPFFGRVIGDTVAARPIDQRNQPFLASVTFLGARKLLLSGRLALVIDVPIAHADVVRGRVVSDTGGVRTVEIAETVLTEIVNPYFGLEFPGAWAQELGVRIQHRGPAGPGGIGFDAEVERAAAFRNRWTTIQYGVTYRPERELGVHGRGRFALEVLLSDQASPACDVTYRGMLQFDRERYRVAFGLAGGASLPNLDATHQLEAVAQTSWGHWRSALHVRKWLKEVGRDFIPVVVGLRLEWHG